MQYLKQLFTIWKQYIVTSLVRSMEFRFNFIAEMSVWLVWFGTTFLIANIFFLHTNVIAGWEKNDIYILISTATLIIQLFESLFFEGIHQLTFFVTEGKMDIVFTKPIHPIFQLLFSRFEVVPFIQLFFSLILLVLFLVRSENTIHPISVILYVFLCLLAIIIQIGIYLALQSLAFWFTRIENIRYLFYSMQEFNRTPTAVFHRFEILLFTIVPAAYIGNVQTLVLFGKGTMQHIMGAIIVAIVALICGISLFTIGARRYTSASS